MLQKDLGSAIPLEQITLDMATISTFDKMLARYCAAFYRVRVQEDLTIKVKLPTKENAIKVAMNEIYKQTNGPFLIKLCFDVRTLPVIAKKPVVEPLVDEIEEIAPPRIVTTLVSPTEISPHEVSNAFLSRLPDLLLDMNNMSYQAFKHSMEYDSEKLTLSTKLLEIKLFNRLIGYIKLNIPSEKSHLFPNKHWVWDSYKSKLNLISTILIAAGHIVPNDILQFRCNDVSLL